MSSLPSPTAVPRPAAAPESTRPPVIVVGLDDSPGGVRALAWAVEEAARRGARLRVITAWHWEATEAVPLMPVDPDLIRASAEAVQADALAALRAHRAALPEISWEVVETAAAQAIVAASHEADLVVLGTHGRGAVRSFLLGSVSLAVIRHSACPVVVMPPQHEAEAAPADPGVATAGSAGPGVGTGV